MLLDLEVVREETGEPAVDADLLAAVIADISLLNVEVVPAQNHDLRVEIQGSEQ